MLHLTVHRVFQKHLHLNASKLQAAHVITPDNGVGHMKSAMATLKKLKKKINS
jgi:hypothetical protein